MGISRREFLQGAAAFSLGGYVIPQDFVMANKRHPLNIIQGPTNESVTQLAIDLPKTIAVRYELFEHETARILPPQVLQESRRKYSRHRVDFVRFSGLQLGEEYSFRVIEAKSGTVLDQRTLAALDTQKKNARVSFVSCMREMSPTRDEMWSYVLNSRPDAIFLQGDNVYGDINLGVRFHGPEILWLRYIMTRNAVPFYHWPRLVPAFAVWDDHDFGKNDVNGNYKHRNNSLSTFDAFYAQKPIEGFYKRGPGVSSSFDLFGHKIFFLDGRFWRREPGVYGQGFLGDEQLAWFANEISNSSKPIWLVSGSQFFGGYQHGASYEETGRDGEFDAFTQVVRAVNQPLLFSSGDLHYSEIMHINRAEFGFKAFEMTSSCLHSNLDKKLPANARRTNGTLKENFMFLDFNGSEPSYDVTCIGVGNRLRFTQHLQF